MQANPCCFYRKAQEHSRGTVHSTLPGSHRTVPIAVPPPCSTDTRRFLLIF
ncbi:hypothetical protein GBAR_LOCUS59 [Geodia barretti]|uniref:Uncharacterized protein n=1 Tax=Geodia barretti TaxID=519541 RepID=A0AA35QS23_GEOBA|nr:hypothetical protein GBAR_LOCUS59 [Geodia barretti]